MAHTIEVAKSGRASCKACKQSIAKGDLRFGEEFNNQFSDSGGTSYRWHHLACAAKKLPLALKGALELYDGEVPNRAEIDATIEAAKAKAKPASFPYADHASTGRSKCIACHEPIAKGALRVAIEREIDTGMVQTKGAGYMHPACVAGWLGGEHAGEKTAESLADGIEANSTAIDAAALAEIRGHLASGSA
jgi:Poly(ADP-ribose) polymerase and DNA-Ligase Zn-finger region